MYFAILALSFVGPVYAAFHGWPIEAVAAWAALWAAIRVLASLRPILAVLREPTDDNPPKWLTSRYMQIPGVLIVALVFFEGAHLGCYEAVQWMLRGAN